MLLLPWLSNWGFQTEQNSASHDLMKVKQASCKTLECQEETKGYFLINRVPSNLQWPKAQVIRRLSTNIHSSFHNSSFRNFKFSDAHKNNQQKKHISKIWSIHKWHHPRIFLVPTFWLCSAVTSQKRHHLFRFPDEPLLVPQAAMPPPGQAEANSADGVFVFLPPG